MSTNDIFKDCGLNVIYAMIPQKRLANQREINSTKNMNHFLLEQSLTSIDKTIVQYKLIISLVKQSDRQFRKKKAILDTLIRS